MGSLGKLHSESKLCCLVPPPALILTQPKPPEIQTEVALDKAPPPLWGLCMSHPSPVCSQGPQAEKGFYNIWLGDSSGPLLSAFKVILESQGDVHQVILK